MACPVLDLSTGQGIHCPHAVSRRRAERNPRRAENALTGFACLSPVRQLKKKRADRSFP